MENKEDSTKNKIIIDKEADFRAGGYHNTYSHEFENSQKNNDKPMKEKSVKELDKNLKNKQNDKLTQQTPNLKDSKKDSLPTNKNYGWKEGFDRSESYGSELKKNTDANPIAYKDQDSK